MEVERRSEFMRRVGSKTPQLFKRLLKASQQIVEDFGKTPNSSFIVGNRQTRIEIV